jgi:FlaA1/EpsC-like NDP-sugar epimerase
MLQGQVVAVTGAGGSIGGELCRQILRYQPRRLLLIEQSEGLLFLIEQELIESGFKESIVPLVADICDGERIKGVFAEHKPAIVFHAAAHKHVPMMESQPVEAIKNNALGTARLGQAALHHGVRKFVLISTDKAINPTSVMGASKRMAEMFLQALWAANPAQTRFISVRFGNVLGSSGSVVPIFQKQIAAGGPVKVTHPEVTRYFMTIPEAVGLVLQSGTMGGGGEIFLLDMGKPVKILDLARKLILLQGLKPDEDISVEFTGLRPGEKMFEELNYNSEMMETTGHAKVYRLTTTAPRLEVVMNLLAELERHFGSATASELKRLMTRLVPEYRPGTASADRDKLPAVPQNRTDSIEAQQLLANPGYSSLVAASPIMPHQP